MNLNRCNICPRNCLVDRSKDLGFCRANDKLKIARAALHFWEEPSISGVNGSGTIFFSHCNMKCIFCQNKKISTNGYGDEITIERFSDICLELQEKNAHNINLVTPTHYLPLIKEGLILAKKKGLKIPVVYNTSSYETVESLKEMEGLIDIYLPDLKYFDDEISIKYSKCPKYFHHATLALQEMYRQVGKNTFNEDGMLTRGMVVRHLMLPTHLEDSKKIVKYLYDTYQDNIYISLMNQYTPLETFKFLELNNLVSEEEYDELIDYALDLGIKNAYIQEGETQSESFIPEFNKEGVH